jgi:hypothetical protein
LLPIGVVAFLEREKQGGAIEDSKESMSFDSDSHSVLAISPQLGAQDVAIQSHRGSGVHTIPKMNHYPDRATGFEQRRHSQVETVRTNIVERTVDVGGQVRGIDS